MADKQDQKKIKEAIKRRKREVYTPVVPEMQLGFVHNNVDCLGCRACEIACKDKNGLPAGPRFRRVMYIEGGRFPDVYAYKVNVSCNHCAEPACLPTCPTGAIFKRKKDGIVDIDSTLCIGCRRCEAACPYGAPQFDPSDGLVKKCNLCVDEIEAGRKPYCVMACMMRTLDVGPIDLLRANKYETKAIGPGEEPVRAVKNFANPELTNPSIVFVPHSKGKLEVTGTPDPLRDFRAAVAADLGDLAALHDRELDAAALGELRTAGASGLLRLRLVNASGRDALLLLDEALAGLPEVVDGALTDALAADYADIYLTYGLRAAPNESVWLDEDNLAMQAPMFEVRELYRRHGLQAPDWRRRADDHLVHELQFLAHLMDPATGDTLDEAAAFLDEHLLLWAPDFAARVAQRCATPLYAGLATVTAAYLDELRELLERILGQPRIPRAEVEERRRRAKEPDPAPAAFVPGTAPTW